MGAQPEALDAPAYLRNSNYIFSHGVSHIFDGGRSELKLKQPAAAQASKRSTAGWISTLREHNFSPTHAPGKLAPGAKMFCL